MGLLGTVGYFALRGLAAALSGGASEAVFVAGDVIGGVAAAWDVGSTLGDLTQSGAGFMDTIEEALADGQITEEEAEDLREKGSKVLDDAAAVKDAAAELKAELKAMGSKKVNAKDVAAVGKRVSHCAICHAVGVNKRSHVPGHKLAYKHHF